jgi:DNA-binding transcriptional MerR regulator
MSSTVAETDFKSERAGAMLESVERRHHILGLRRRGMTYSQISETLASAELLASAGLDWEPVHVSPSSCAQIVKRYLQKLELEESETRDELRTLENERLDELLRTWLPRARGTGQTPPDPKAAVIVMRLMERRAKLNGLDAPSKVDVNLTGSIMHELAIDPEELERQQESFLTAFGGGDVIEGTAVELPSGDPEDT